MYISEFVCGVVATILAELALIIIVSLIMAVTDNINETNCESDIEDECRRGE